MISSEDEAEDFTEQNKNTMSKLIGTGGKKAKRQMQ